MTPNVAIVTWESHHDNGGYGFRVRRYRGAPE
jgi:hypothetical protein